MEFSIHFTAEGKDRLHKLHIETQSKIKSKLKELSKNLNLGKPLRGNLSGLYTLKVGNYRAVYSFDKERILVHNIGHRKEVYDKR